MNALGVILAGGQAQRMGGIDKGRLKIGDASILEIIIKCLNFQLDKIVLNANGLSRRLSQTWSSASGHKTRGRTNRLMANARKRLKK